jgi:predicted PurR-regulated permease PerM
MGIDSATPQGNGFYKLFRGEFDGLILRANQMLSLTDSETQAFLASRPTPASEDPFFRAFLANAQHPRFGNDARADQALNSQTGATPTAVTEGQKSSTSLAHLLSIWIVTPLILLFLLFDDGQIVRWFVRLVPNRYFELTLTIFDEVDAAMGRYLRGTFLQCGLVGLTIAVGLVLVGLTFEAALLIGAIAGLANAIPFLGPAIGLVISLGYVLVADQITPLLPGMTPDHVFIGVIATIAVAQTLDNIYFQPVVLGAAVNLHPIVVVIGVMAASSMFGFAGMLLAIPAIVIVKVVVETLFTELKAYRII